jgi:prepilin-type processing-associated H-X9-DG protein
MRLGHKKGDKFHGLNAVFGDGHVSMTLLTSSPYLAIAIDGGGWSAWGRNYDRAVEALGALQP